MADLLMSFGARTRTISAPKVIIDEHFEKAFHLICEEWLETYRSNIAFLKRNKTAANRVIAILSKKETERSGFKYEITRLRNTKGYVRFSIGKRNDVVYLIGRTVPIVWDRCRIADGYGAGEYKFHMGPFDVYVPASNLVNGVITNTHLVPVRLPLVMSRTAHHYATWPDLENPDFDEDEEDSYEYLDQTYDNIKAAGYHPVDFPEHTCLGELSTIIQGSTKALDIASLFASWYQHVSVYNYASPLRSISDVYYEWKGQNIDLLEEYHGTEG
jgi:hypothetical protein